MAAATEKAYIGMGMEGAVARWYEKTTRRDMEEFRRLAARLSTMLPGGGDVLEVAPGPGFLAVELAKVRGLRVSGVDVSRTMVELAQKNAKEAGVRPDIRLGSASKMPFASETFDLLVCRAAFKNFAQPAEALKEMRRVLRPGGRAIIIDLRRDVSMEEIDRYVRGLGLGIFSRWTTSLTFRFMLLKRAYTVAGFRELLKRVEFASAEIVPNEIGMEIRLER
ncbi:MAG TPA: class I SAM-dependent methyltransferase [Acidobacteriaceae bacterium]|nr:class I SAM-dependent methyltransferase [Acidobacteriaceae bacterium]